MDDCSRYVMFTDVPPLREGGNGCCVLSYNLLRDLGDLFCLVVSRRVRQDIRRMNVYQIPGVSTHLFPDAPWFRPQRLHPWVDLLLFFFNLPRIALEVRRSKCLRIFALFSADPFFLPKVELLRHATQLPLDVYLVDDLGAISELARQRVKSWIVRTFERRVLARATRVFVISPGFAEHLMRKYRQRAIWLPIPVHTARVEYAPHRPASPDCRDIVFVGSVNALYLDSLCRLYEQIGRWNCTLGRSYKLRLTVLTRDEPRLLLDHLPDHEALEVILDLDSESMERKMRASWAIFLPYSFDPALRVATSTSFSHKFAESVTAGRPVLVFGPPHASIPRYFREEGMPLCAQSPDELASVLAEIEGHDSPALVARYSELIQRHHSSDVLRGILGRPDQLTSF